MMRTSRSGGELRLEGELAGGSVAYVDAEWLQGAAGGPVPSLVVEGDGWIRWEDRREQLPEGFAGDDAAAAVLWRLARAAAELVGDRPTGPVEVTGAGVVADCIRRALPASQDAGPPTAVIETTGAPAAIADATERVRDGGVVVLAGESREPVALNLYPDVHARGLRVRGVAPRIDGLDPAVDTTGPLEPPLDVAQGEPVPTGTYDWLRVAPA